MLAVIDALEPGASVTIAELARCADVHRSFLYRHQDLYEQAVLKRIDEATAERDRLRMVVGELREALTYIAEGDDLADANPAAFGGAAYRRKRHQAQMALDLLAVSGGD